MKKVESNEMNGLTYSIGELLSVDYVAPRKLTKREIAKKDHAFRRLMSKVKLDKPAITSSGVVMWGRTK